MGLKRRGVEEAEGSVPPRASVATLAKMEPAGNDRSLTLAVGGQAEVRTSPASSQLRQPMG